jgi:uncharacterized membrane protein YfcA
MSYQRKSLLWTGLVIILFGTAAAGLGGFNLADAVILFGLCFACELIDSGLGMGYGTILTPTMLMLGYQPQDIVPTILFSELLSGFSASFFHNEIRNVELGFKGRDFSPAVILASGSVLGVTLGVFLSVNIPKEALKIIIGCIILTSGLFVILVSRRVVRYSRGRMLALSGIASFNKAVSGGGYGPLVTSGQILSGVQGKAAVGITSFAEAFTCLFAVILFLLKGGYINLHVLIPMCAGALLSVPCSVFAINKANEDHLKIVVGILTLVMGALTIYKALF